jgi:hypothetical protein
MSFQYNFPAIATHNTLFRQFKKIQEEMRELEDTWEGKSIDATDEEVMDVIHACETYFRLRSERDSSFDINILQKRIEEKNRRRGYYGNNI